MGHLSAEQLQAGLDDVRRSPRDQGRLDLIVVRPSENERAVLDRGDLDLQEGLVGDCWRRRGSRLTPDGGPDPLRQLNIINARVSALLAGDDPARRAAAGDQLHLDLDLSEDILRPGTRLAIGTAVIEVTAPPHTGCAKFARRFGTAAMRLVNAPEGRALNLRGRCARVLVAGTVTTGDTVRRITAPAAQPETVARPPA